MKKIEILVNADFLINHYFSDSKYVGIYYVSLNILEKLKQQSEFNITLSYGLEHIWGNKIKKIKNDVFFKDFSFFFINNSEYKPYINEIKHRIANFKIKSIKRIIKCLIKLIIFKYLEYFNKILLINNEDILKFDIYFSLYNAIPSKLKNMLHIKKFIMLYDIIPFFEITQNEEKLIERENFRLITNSIDKQTYIFCISEYTKYDFKKHFGNKIDFNKMYVCYLFTSNNFIQNYDKNKLNYVFKKYKIELLKNKYILSICSMHPRKNVPFAVKCFLKFIKKNSIDDLYFYLAGASSDVIINGVYPALQDFPEYKDKIVILGYIQEEDINLILSNAMFFVYLSKYEGFGMPPLEAMQAGTPVITSNNSSLPEVVGDAAISVNCEDENEIIKAFESLYYKEDLRLQYIDLGLKQAKLFNLDKTIKTITNVFTNLQS